MVRIFMKFELPPPSITIRAGTRINKTSINDQLPKPVHLSCQLSFLLLPPYLLASLCKAMLPLPTTPQSYGLRRKRNFTFLACKGHLWRERDTAVKGDPPPTPQARLNPTPKPGFHAYASLHSFLSRHSSEACSTGFVIAAL